MLRLPTGMDPFFPPLMCTVQYTELASGRLQFAPDQGCQVLACYGTHATRWSDVHLVTHASFNDVSMPHTPLKSALLSSEQLGS